jgi:hypothetical protein
MSLSSADKSSHVFPTHGLATSDKSRSGAWRFSHLNSPAVVIDRWRFVKGQCGNFTPLIFGSSSPFTKQLIDLAIPPFQCRTAKRRRVNAAKFGDAFQRSFVILELALAVD